MTMKHASSWVGTVDRANGDGAVGGRRGIRDGDGALPVNDTMALEEMVVVSLEVLWW